MAKGKVFQSHHLQRVVDYNSESGSLILEFTNGARYKYADVSFSEYWTLTRSPSAGTVLHNLIKGKKYVKLEPL